MQPLTFAKPAVLARCALALLTSALWAGSAAAASFRIDFYLGEMTGDPFTSDWDGDGLIDYSGLFTTQTVGSGPLASFDVTIGNVRYNVLDSGSSPGVPHYFEPSAGFPIPALLGEVLEHPFAGPGDSQTVLQLGGISLGDAQGNFAHYGTWALSPCVSEQGCGGGPRLGSYTITALNTVPAPASLPLVALGLLAAWRRRPG